MRRRLRTSRMPVSLDGRSWRDSRRNCVRNLPWKISGNHQHSEQQLFHYDRRWKHWWVSLSAPTPMQIENGAETHSKNGIVTCTEYNMTLMQSAGPMKLSAWTLQLHRVHVWVTVWLGSTGLRYNRRWSMSFQSNVLSMFWRLWASSCCYITTGNLCFHLNTWSEDNTSCRWQRSWGVTHRCCQLQSLSRLSQQNPEAVLNLRGIHTWKRVNKALYVLRVGLNCSILLTFWKMSWLTENDEWIKMMYGKLLYPFLILF